jgi:hypothetical protein
MSPFNAKSLLEYWPTIKYPKNNYIYISLIYIRVFFVANLIHHLATRKKNGSTRYPKGFFFGEKKKGLKSPYLEGGKKRLNRHI